MLNSSRRYIQKIIAIIVCIVIAGLLYYAFIFSIMFLAYAIKMMFYINKRYQTCLNCHKEIECPEKYIIVGKAGNGQSRVDSILNNPNYLQCDGSTMLVYMHVLELLHSVAKNRINDFIVAFDKIKFDNLRQDEKKAYLDSKFSNLPTNIEIVVRREIDIYYYEIFINVDKALSMKRSIDNLGENNS